jgi:hypothetical protein
MVAGINSLTICFSPHYTLLFYYEKKDLYYLILIWYIIVLHTFPPYSVNINTWLLFHVHYVLYLYQLCTILCYYHHHVKGGRWFTARGQKDRVEDHKIGRHYLLSTCYRCSSYLALVVRPLYILFLSDPHVRSHDTILIDSTSMTVHFWINVSWCVTQSFAPLPQKND